MEINSKTIIDISMPLDHNTVVWIEDSQPNLKPICRLPEDECNFTWLDFGAHAGTHVDAPYYLFTNGWTTDQIPLSRLVGPCQVLDLSNVTDTIGPEDLEQHTITSHIILLKTQNSFDTMKTYNPTHVQINDAAARYLLATGVQTLGFDYQSFERNGANVIHRIFLEKSITLLDNLRLGHVEPGMYTLLCLPIKVMGIDGAPARAVLLP